jgi:hypothetical protein
MSDDLETENERDCREAVRLLAEARAVIFGMRERMKGISPARQTYLTIAGNDADALIGRVQRAASNGRVK